MPFEDAVFGSVRRYASVFLRLALGAAFLSGVADRFGLWGPAGTVNVAWGDFQRFTAYTAQLSPWAPAPTVPALAWAATVAELVLGVALILGFFTRGSALLSGVLLLLFAFGMTVGTGFKSALNASVFLLRPRRSRWQFWGPGSGPWTPGAARALRNREDP